MYHGTELQSRIEAYLDFQIKEDISVNDIFKSQQNQKFFSQIDLGSIGNSTIFGHNDAYFQRDHSYSLIMRSTSAEIYTVDAD